MAPMSVGLGVGLKHKHAPPPAGNPGTAPNLVADLAGWWAADDAGITLNGSYVSGLPDKSGNGYNLTQGTQAQQFTYVANAKNGKAVLRGTSSTQFLSSTVNFPITGNLACTVIGAYNSSVANDVTKCILVSWGSGGVALQAFILAGATPSANYLGIAYGGAQNSKFANGWTTGPQIVTLTKSPGAINTTSAARHNGTDLTIDASSSTSTPNVAAARVDIGEAFYASLAGYGFIGDIYEIAVWSRVLSGSEIANVETYLNTKWGCY